MKVNFFILFIAGALMLSGCVSQSETTTTLASQTTTTIESQTTTTIASQTTTTIASQTTTTIAQGEVKEFTVEASNWKFEPSTITVNQGDHVIIHVTSLDVGHGIALPKFGVNVKVAPGETKTAEFDATEKGTFPFFCNVFCGEGHRDMQGSLVVN